MKLYHATPKRNLSSIRDNGLDPNQSVGKRKEIWLHTQSRREWEIQHTMKRHSVSFDAIAVIEVSVPRKYLTRRRRGIWTTKRIITTITIPTIDSDNLPV